ncbi:hypothetical protein D9758_006432 [Tetrapyrgos nigripes]|uniref:Uncharacterized protein n=1 Tax=Tetrapyrgos nigripes TaxID=182062 RepID=A0A8H5BR52_9AGAR|nr:hypothetical protein D9758_017698 [Tetrapyrgos nigripes]KAF5366801.1 hypothetical protein D9758_006432 [Tetrapyrgos nigripes]
MIGTELSTDDLSFSIRTIQSPSTRSTSDGMKVHHIFAFLVKSCFYFGGRVVVATVPSSSPSLPLKRSVTPQPGSKEEEEKEKDSKEVIAGVACWLPPGKRINIWNLPVTAKCGVFKILRKAGFGGFNRIVLQYMDQEEKTHAAAFRDRARKSSPDSSSSGKKSLKPDDAWYLSMVMTVKEFEGQGCLSLLMREGYAHAAKTAASGGSVPPFILESSSPRSRDRYIHLGYEIEDHPPTIVGVGKVDSDGLKASKETRRKGKAPGVEYWCMVNWDPKV